MIMKKRILAVLLTGIIAAALPLTAYGAGNDKNTDVPLYSFGGRPESTGAGDSPAASGRYRRRSEKIIQ